MAEARRIMTEFAITGDFIELDKLLKASGLCGTGGEARGIIREGLVSVDGETELRLRRKIRPGTAVRYNDLLIAVRSA